jgi:hypothetical protein
MKLTDKLQNVKEKRGHGFSTEIIQINRFNKITSTVLSVQFVFLRRIIQQLFVLLTIREAIVVSGSLYVPKQGKTVPDGFQSVPQPGETFPDGFQSVPQPGEAVPDGFQSVPQPGETFPGGFQSVPQPGETVPDGFQSVPQPGETFPDGFQSVPKPEETFPDRFWFLTSLRENFQRQILTTENGKIQCLYAELVCINHVNSIIKNNNIKFKTYQL